MPLITERGSSRVHICTEKVCQHVLVQYMDGLSPRVAYAQQRLCMDKHITGIVIYMDVGWIKALRRHTYAETGCGVPFGPPHCRVHIFSLFLYTLLTTYFCHGMLPHSNRQCVYSPSRRHISDLFCATPLEWFLLNFNTSSRPVHFILKLHTLVYAR